ncbi:DNA methyltransferase [Afipia carboxidovorans]|uniref:DNA methyltransferase n=1 Tax=Afipia carboxidovorans TaxID=40137 RepID=UPI00308A9365|nr:hypothetical protein CRBSH125_09000 [Afipia carboxidovorans]
MNDYRSFIEGKVAVAGEAGFDVAPHEINPQLKDFVRAIVAWAAQGGRRGIFSSFGLHKTSAQIELARLCRIKTGSVPLIILPLGVRQEFFDDAEQYFKGDYRVRLKFIRSTVGELEEGNEQDLPLIYLTNYESVREGKIDTSKFGFVSLDEAACLRGFGGSKTFREFMARLAGDARGGAVENEIRYRFVATATPDPNEHIELLAYAAFLGIMDVGQAKTRFFKRNSEKADELTIHPHKEREFWLWVASWALFVSKPSDLGFSDEGYVLPELDIRWHEIPADHTKAGTERDGQAKFFADEAIGVQNASKVKRDSLPQRIDLMAGLIASDPDDHCLLWHDLEAERLSIEKTIPSVRSIFGSQDLDVNEANAIGFKRGEFPYLATKPSMSGAGCNFQYFCHWMIFLGIGFKFHDFIQAVHRLMRFGQTKKVRLDLIYTEQERSVRRKLEERWKRHDEQSAIMADIIKEYGLTRIGIAGALKRTIGVNRVEVRGDRFVCVNNDCVEETRSMAGDSVDLIVTSIPFSTQYEYTPSYNDFGHTDDDAHFFRQMDFLTPELLRILKPGRIAMIHCKDRIVPGGLTGLGFQTVSPFGAETMLHFRKHGFAYIGTKTIITDVVRENNQTYRLGWTEQCKDGTRMGFGLPEYVHVFRKPQTDRSKGYADEPVVKDKAEYSRGRWQLDAHGFGRSSGNRLLSPVELLGQEAKVIYRRWREHSLSQVYDFEHHVAVSDTLDANKQLPPTFMLLPPHSWHPDVETDVARMRTLNGLQHAKGRELHLCPLQFDIVDRAITQYTMPGETVFDPFGGLMTVPYRAIALKRRGIGVELSPSYFRDGVTYCQEAEREADVPTLFDLLSEEGAAA